MMNELDIKTMPQSQLEAVYLNLNIQTQLNQRMLELLLSELLNRKANIEVGSFDKVPNATL